MSAGKIALVRAILEKAESFSWTVQGFGMMRLHFTGGTRLHVWHPSLRTPGVSDIHDHGAWSFESEVIAGEIENTIYGVFITDEERATHMQGRITTGAGARLGEKTSFVALPRRKVTTYRTGMKYAQLGDVVHSTETEPGTVTLITRTFHSDHNCAYSFWPKGTKWVSAEPRPATQDEVESVAHFALERWFR